ncbi:ALP1-like protein [Tanacetum coccineum]
MLEAVASYDLWIWHAFFRAAGANNDLNVLTNSLLFYNLLNDIAPIAPFEVNEVGFEKGYYLAGEIYPHCAIFVKSFTVARDEKMSYLNDDNKVLEKMLKELLVSSKDPTSVGIRARFLIKIPPMRNKNINDVYEQEFEQCTMTRIEERLDQLVEEESMPVYDIDIEDVIEEKEGFVGKGGFGGEEDYIKDVVVVANDLCSSMIQTTLSVNFEEDINTKSHELMSFGKDDNGLRSSHYKERECDARDTNLDATSTRDE